MNIFIFKLTSIPKIKHCHDGVRHWTRHRESTNGCWWTSPSSFYPSPSQLFCSPRSGPGRSRQHLRIPERGVLLCSYRYNDDGWFIYLLRIIQWSVVNANRIDSNIKRIYINLVNNWRPSNNYLRQSLALVFMNR